MLFIRACGRDFRCDPSSLTCVALRDYSKSGIPEGFGACNKSWDCGKACVKSECRFDCASGRCHVPGVLNICSGACKSLTTCVRGRCVYGTEGTPCNPSALEPCIRGLRCESTQGQSGGTCRKGRIGMSCTSSDRCGPGLLCGRLGSAPVARMGSRASLTFSARPGFVLPCNEKVHLEAAIARQERVDFSSVSGVAVQVAQ